MLLMLATCVAVIALGVVMVSVFGVGQSALFLLLAVFCPLSHWLMMRSMQNQAGSMEKRSRVLAARTQQFKINNHNKKRGESQCPKLPLSSELREHRRKPYNAERVELFSW
jgi:hypothetical protein